MEINRGISWDQPAKIHRMQDATAEQLQSHRETDGVGSNREGPPCAIQATRTLFAGPTCNEFGVFPCIPHFLFSRDSHDIPIFPWYSDIPMIFRYSHDIPMIFFSDPLQQNCRPAEPQTQNGPSRDDFLATWSRARAFSRFFTISVCPLYAAMYLSTNGGSSHGS